MPGDFHLIDIYRNLCQGAADAESIMLNTDQEVPQTNPVSQEEIAPVSIKAEPASYYPYEFHDTLLNEMTSTSFPAPSAGCTTVTEVPDQQLRGGNSPCQLIDLDIYSGNDPTLYDHSSMDMKPQTVMPAYPSSSPEESMDQDEEIDDVLYYLATKDIMGECAALEISPNPTLWSIADVGKWIAHMCKKYCIDVPAELFQMNGKCLCLLSEKDFEWRAPLGSHLYAQLEIWKNYFQVEDIYHDAPEAVDTATPFDMGRHCSSPYSLSPASPGSSSLDSTASSQESSPQRCTQSLEEAVFTFQTKIQGRPPKSETMTPRPTEHKQTIHLWQFLKELLLKPESFSSCIKWLDRSKGIFKIEDSSRVAKEWGRRKNRPAMNYDKLSRSIRQYYKKGIIKKTEHSKRLVYQFCAPYL